jgi:hypothetical protein
VPNLDEGSTDSKLSLRTQCIGGGTVAGERPSLRLSFSQASAQAYTDAEVNDYQGHRRFAWRPPLRLVLRAQASHPAAHPASPEDSGDVLLGTAGFGFWNAPFLVAKRSARPPEAIWFLYASPPTRLSLIPHGPAWGWKAQVVHTHRWGALASLGPTLATVLWARLSGNEAPAARWVQRLSGAHETMIASDLAQWHEYRLDWTAAAATFFVDGEPIGAAPRPPRGPLGFVAWIDNQYVVATPNGTFRSGVLQTGPQWLEIADLAIAPLS